MAGRARLMPPERFAPWPSRGRSDGRRPGPATAAPDYFPPALPRLCGDAISAFVPGQLRNELQTGLCVKLPLTQPNLSVNYGFITKRGRTLSPASKAFMEIVREIERAIPES